MKKDAREVVEILEAFDLTGSAHSAAELAGCDPKRVRHWVALRERGAAVAEPVRRERLIGPFVDKVEGWVDRWNGRVRADVVHERLTAVGFVGDERTTRRAVEAAKARWDAGHRRMYRPWITEAGMWCQFDWGVGPLVPFAGGAPRVRLLFCVWLAWSRLRVVIPTWDRTLPTLLGCLDTSLRRPGGAPRYALTDNDRTVTVEHVARVAVRHPEVVAAGRHYRLRVATCVPFDPGSKGGSEVSVRVAKADLVPTEANLLDVYPDMGALLAACDTFGDTVNARRHRETGVAPHRAAGGRAGTAACAALGPVCRGTRADPAGQHRPDDQVRVGALPHPAGLVGTEVWVRANLSRSPAPPRSTRRSGWLPRPGGSPRMTCSRSCNIAPPAPPTAQLVVADEHHSAQPGTSAWEGFGR